jgi:hypothetical protein
MRRSMIVLVAILMALTLGAQVASAGNPHFVRVSAERQGDSLVVSFKEAGLGNEDQVHIVVSATAACVNRGGNKPSAENKQSVSAAGDFPVQNGRAQGTLTLTPTFQPRCSPPMTIEFTNVTITDETSGISRNLTGTF